MDADTFGTILKCPDYQGILRCLNFPMRIAWDLEIVSCLVTLFQGVHILGVLLHMYCTCSGIPNT